MDNTQLWRIPWNTCGSCTYFTLALFSIFQYYPHFLSLYRKPQFLFYWEGRCCHRRERLLSKASSLCGRHSFLDLRIDFLLSSKADTVVFSLGAQSVCTSSWIILVDMPICCNYFQKKSSAMNLAVSSVNLCSHQISSKAWFFPLALSCIHSRQALCLSFLLLP